MYGDAADSANSSFALLGYSGVGKSTSLKQLLMDYPQVILHKVPGSEDVIPQIVYLVVNCLPNSNFNEMYISIGKAVDRALGNIQPYYEEVILKTKGLSSKMNKVIELIETFNIGIILLDEIQLIDFKHTKENSFEGLMTIVNATKISIAVIGTEDAYSKMFINLRNARRVGTLIDASTYTENDSYFKNIVSFMMNYQWFDTWVDCDEDMVNALKKCSYGIIDQLISLYVMMHIYYFEKKGKKPKVNGDYVRMVSRKYFPYMKQLNNLLKDPMSDNCLKKASEETKNHLKELLKKSEEQNKESEAKQIELSDMMLNIAKIKEPIIKDIENVGFDRIEIEKCFNKLIKKGLDDMSNREIKQTIISELTKPKLRARGKNKPLKKKCFKQSLNNKLALCYGCIFVILK
nr:AAA family ATPase [Faecalicoccus acidiformans]